MRIVEYALKYASSLGIPETHVVFAESRGFRVEVEADAISKVSFSKSSSLNITIIVDKKIASVATNDLSESNVKRAIDRAFSMARASRPNPFWSGLPEPKPYPEVEGLYDDRIANMDAELMVELMKTGLQSVKETSTKVTVMQGCLSTGEGRTIIANSNGIFGESKGTSVNAYLVTVAKEGSEIGSFALEDAVSRRLDIDVEELGESAAKKALESLHLKPIRGFKGPVILDYDVAGGIFSVLSSAYNGYFIWRNSSPLKGKIGEQIAVEELTVIDDGTLPSGIASSPFDREGSPTMRKVIIEKGILKTYINNTFTARILQMSPTGNASSLLNVAPTNTIVKPGDWSIDEMIESVKQGLFVRRFSGSIRVQDGLVSGAVKQAFYIENGEKKYPVRECMISGNLYQMIRNISAISRETKVKRGLITPVLKVEELAVVGK